MKVHSVKPTSIFLSFLVLVSCISISFFSESVSAGSYDGADLAQAIVADVSSIVSSQYSDSDGAQNRQGTVLSSLGTMYPTQGSTFVLLSTGIAGASIVTTDGTNPGNERGEWFTAGQYQDPGEPPDRAELILQLRVPEFMHYLYYDVQFFTSEYPDYIGSMYNDELRITVVSPNMGTTVYTIDVNSGDFVLDSSDITGTGFDIYAKNQWTGQPTDPSGPDWVSTTPGSPGIDGGATALITREHPVHPGEIVTITFRIKDTGDNMFDSAAFIDNIMFSGYAKTDIIARKTLLDVNGDPLECGDTIRYSITISNIGTADQHNNPGNEFEDIIPENTSYNAGSAQANSGTIGFSGDRIIWNGNVPAQSSVSLHFNVTVNGGLINDALVSNQGIVYWDSDEDWINDAFEYTDDPAIDDGIDLDGDGETDDDDPTEIRVTSFEAPSELTEDFSDDAPGGIATQTYFDTIWFETSTTTAQSSFEVASSYFYETLRSFKTKIRAVGGPVYWTYNLSSLLSDLDWWEVWFACGNASEPYTLYLEFENTGGNPFIKLKVDYTYDGGGPPTDYIANFYYWQTGTGWAQLNSDPLSNGWYKLRIAKNSSMIEYSLYSSIKRAYYNTTGTEIGIPFANFARIKWSSDVNPIVCPIFFWDEHRIGLIN